MFDNRMKMVRQVRQTPFAAFTYFIGVKLALADTGVRCPVLAVAHPRAGYGKAIEKTLHVFWGMKSCFRYRPIWWSLGYPNNEHGPVTAVINNGCNL